MPTAESYKLPTKPRPKKVKPAPKRKLTCAYFKRTHPNAGPKAYAKLGLRYYACNIPKPKVIIPPVMG